jgi:hypothetical protein
MHYQKFVSDNENISLKMRSFLCQDNFPNRASKIRYTCENHVKEVELAIIYNHKINGYQL